MSIIWSIVQIVYVLNAILAGITVFREERDISATWAWLLVLNLLPIVGFVIYMFLGKKISKQKIFDIKSQERLGLNELVANQKEMLQDKELVAANSITEDASEMVSLFLQTDQSILTKKNHVEIFIDGIEKFNRLAQDLLEAKDHIHIEYYTFANDELGHRLLKILEDKAANGVEVRLIYDAFGSRGTSHHMFKRLEELGGHAEPFFGSHFSIINLRFNFRDHRKIVIVDGKIGYIGGFNVADQYETVTKKFGYWRDTHIRIRGNGVLSLQSRFLMDWNATSNIKDQVEFEAHYFPNYKVHGTTSLQVVSSGPDSELEQIKKGYIKMLSIAKKYIWIQSPYFIPDDSVLEAMSIAVLSGIDVRLMIPNKPDHPFVYRATQHYAKLMVATGVKVYVYDNGFLHAKTVVMDGEIASVGSANFDFRSFKLNFEANAFLYDRQIASQLEEIYLKDIEDSYELTDEIIKKMSPWLRFKQAFSRLFSPIL